jgi:hypothetical protein
MNNIDIYNEINKINYKKLYNIEKIKREEYELKIIELNKKINFLKITNTSEIKGLMCSINGNNYEKKIYNIVKRCSINNKKFNTQENLGGSSNKIDILCNYNSIEDIGIEIKKYNSPDWMQSTLRYDCKIKKWIIPEGKNNNICREIFNNLIKNINIYDGDIPPFIKKSITHEEWIKIKKETNKWNDIYLDIPEDTITKLYQSKGCKYIQISDNYGLYHLGNDICNFNVPIFKVNQKLRIRTKIHTKKDNNGFCKLSVTISCYPIKIKEINKSKYTLDDKDKLPKNIIYHYD